MKRDDFYSELHKKNSGSFWELVKRISKGFLQIVYFSVEEDERGHKRVTILIHEVN